jgi:hypothetical protein
MSSPVARIKVLAQVLDFSVVFDVCSSQKGCNLEKSVQT